jgi:hypothetical protein
LKWKGLALGANTSALQPHSAYDSKVASAEFPTSLNLGVLIVKAEIMPPIYPKTLKTK